MVEQSYDVHNSELEVKPPRSRQAAGGLCPDSLGLEGLIKSGFDRSIAALTLIMLAPSMLAVAILIKALDPGPAFYAHTRIGCGGWRFQCLKFRTMRIDGDAVLERHLARNPEAAKEWLETRKLKEDPRVTHVGRFLRKSSLDELPQLINILRGEMSLVGPRPIVEDELVHYQTALDDYLAVKPGLTGLWQISGRSTVGYSERVQLDKHYVQTRSFGGDLMIILRTIPAVVKQKGSF